MSEAIPMTVKLEKASVNMFNVIGFAAVLVVNAFGLGITYNTMITADAKAVEEIAVISTEIKEIRSELPKIDALQFQVTRTVEQISENRAGLDAANKRIDRVVEMFGSKIDLVIENLNKLSTQVSVINSRLEETPKPTAY